MKNLFIILATLFLAIGCYNTFTEPGPEHIYTDKDFEDEEFISIAELKEFYLDECGGNLIASMGKPLTIDEDWVVEGRVISSDRTGNVYKSVFLWDGEAAIELRLHSGYYMFYPPGTTLYVKMKGLTMGNYRQMISIGLESRNAEYANGNLEDMYLVEQHVKKGRVAPLRSRDTLVVTKDNYRTMLSDEDLGRLVRFEGLTSKWGTSKWGYKNAFPNYFANSTSFDWVDIYPLDEADEPTWACSVQDKKTGVTTYYYGSAWFGYDDSEALAGNYVVRTSGYAQFKWLPIPEDGDKADITAIYTKFTGPGGDDSQAAYQLMLNSAEDVTIY